MSGRYLTVQPRRNWFGAARLSRRAFVVAGGATGAALLAACGASPAAVLKEAEPTAPVTLEYWPHWDSTSNAKGYAALADAFTGQNPKITIHTTSYKNNVEKLLAAIVAGTPPDVAILRGHGQSLAVKSAIQPLDDRLSKARLFKKGDYNDAQWEQNAWKGKVYGVPAMENGARGALVYNKKLFAEAGLDPTKPPKTMDDLLKAHERLTKDDGGIKQLGFDSWDAMSLEGFLEQWGSGAYGAKFYEVKNLKLNLNSPEMLDAVQTFVGFRIRLGWDKVADFRKLYETWFTKKAGLTLGTQAMQIDGYWNPGSIRLNAAAGSDVPSNLLYTWIPTQKGTEKVQESGGWAAVLPSGIKQPDLSWRWVEFLGTAKANQILLDEFGFLNGNKAILKELKYETTPQLKFYLDSLSQADRVIPHVALPSWTDLDSGYRGGLDSVGQGKTSVKAMLDDLQTRMQQRLDEVVKAS